MDRKVIFIISSGFLLGAGLGLLIFITVGLGNDSSISKFLPTGKSIPNAYGVGNPASTFKLKDLEGNLIQLDDFKGKPVLINFWATWCGPCRFEMPVIQSRYNEYGDELVVIAINFDEPERVVQQFVDELGLSFIVLLDPGGAVQRDYRVRAYPTTYFLDEESVVKLQHIGYMSEAQLDQYLGQIGVGE